MSVEMTQSGPIFDQRAEAAVKEAERDWTKGLATIGASMVRTNLNAVLRTQTPHYRLLVEARADAPGWKIWDRSCIYGPWLEGTGSRNRTTRFKGYATFRRTTQQIQARADAVGQPIVARYVGKMR